MRVPKIRSFSWAFSLLAGVLLLALGMVLATDRAGLRTDYFAVPAGSAPWPVFTAIGAPRVESRQDVAGVLVSQEIFDLRWRGWLSVAGEGEYEFLVRSDEAAFLELDGQRVVSTARREKAARSGAISLSKGLHPLTIAFSQTGGKARLSVQWGSAGGELESLAGADLIARHPASIRAFLRGWLPGMGSSAIWRIVGLLAVGAGLLLVFRASRPWRTSLNRAVVSSGGWNRLVKHRRLLGGVLLVLLFLGSAFLAFPYTASTTDGDDVRYMDGARFDKQMGWNMNRYAHIYMLKGFIGWAQGDVFQASRIQWAFIFGMTIVALAVAVSALGPGLQWVTLLVTLALLFSQSYLFGGIGAAYADYSAMMFVALGLAVYLHGYSTRPSSSSYGHAALLGALTVAAAKSKEPGVIMLWLALALLWSGGRIDLRRFGKRMVWWIVGATIAYLVLMTLDAWVLGDFWFSLRLESVAGAQRLKAAAEEIWQLSRFAWLDVIWTPGPLRSLTILTGLATLLAFLRPVGAELRWIALMPAGFVLMMIAIHPAILSPRYLFPIVPVACFVGAMMIRTLLASVTLRKGRRWVPVAGVALILGALFGNGLVDTWTGLARHRVKQRGDWTLYPWQTFEDEIRKARPREILVSPRLYRTYLMLGKSKTRDRIARLFFQRRHLRLREYRNSGPSPELAILSRSEFNRWVKALPEIEDRARFDSSGQIVLVLPE